MQVKVGDKVYSAEDEPIMVILTDLDKTNIARMEQAATKYCCFPTTEAPGTITDFMNTELECATVASSTR